MNFSTSSPTPEAHGVVPRGGLLILEKRGERARERNRFIKGPLIIGLRVSLGISPVASSGGGAPNHLMCSGVRPLPSWSGLELDR